MSFSNVISRTGRQAEQSETGIKRWSAYIVQGFLVLFLLFDALPKIAQMDFVVEACGVRLLGDHDFGHRRSFSPSRFCTSSRALRCLEPCC